MASRYTHIVLCTACPTRRDERTVARELSGLIPVNVQSHVDVAGRFINVTLHLIHARCLIEVSVVALISCHGCYMDFVVFKRLN